MYVKNLDKFFYFFIYYFCQNNLCRRLRPGKYSPGPTGDLDNRSFYNEDEKTGTERSAPALLGSIFCFARGCPGFIFGVVYHLL